MRPIAGFALVSLLSLQALATPIPDDVTAFLEGLQDLTDTVVNLTSGAKQLTIGCQPEDLTTENWVTNSIDDYIRTLADFGTGKCLNKIGAYFMLMRDAETVFPQRFMTAQSVLPDFSPNCQDFNQPELCVVPLSIAPGDDAPSNICASFKEPQVGFIAQAYLNMYNNLRNMYNAITDAHDQLVNEGYINELVKDISPEPLPIPRSVLLKLSELSLSFIPTPVGPELAAFKPIMKGFKKIAGKALKNAGAGAEDIEQTLKDQPKILGELLDSVVVPLQLAILDQLNDIFFDAHDNSFEAQDFLLGGFNLQPVRSREDYAATMANNLRLFLLSQVMTKVGVVLIIDNLVGENGDLCKNAGDSLIDNGSRCRHFVVPQPNTPITLVTSDKSSNLNDIARRTNTKFSDIADNAQACRQSGKDASEVDFAAFLEGGGSGGFPDCFSGISVTEQKF